MDTRSQHIQTTHIDLPANDDRDKPRSANNEESTVFGDSEKGLAENMLKTLHQILDVLRGSTIAEERGEDTKSKFWATYKKVSNEYDDDFLERANDDMDIILTFAGLFSTVSSTFIVAMQPNPGNTTNVLMVQLIEILANGPDAVNISNLPSSTTYSSSTVWMQTLAYASLSFSLLAAFGAVMGKQWLHSYKACRGRGSLEERGQLRQMKLDGLEYWQLQAVLGAFLILLQISLFLFGLSLSANIFAQEITISSVVIGTTAFGMIFYVATILVSVLNPDSPFHTPGSKLVEVLCKNLLPDRSNYGDNVFAASSAVRWILETSTNPEFVAATAAMVPLVEWLPEVDVSGAYKCLSRNCAISFGSSELSLKAMTHLLTQSVKIDPYDIMCSVISSDTRNRLIRNAFTVGRRAWDWYMTIEENFRHPIERTPTDDAVRTILVYGRHGCLSHPDDEYLIWNGDLQWCHNDGLAPSREEFDWLIDYLAETIDNHDIVKGGDALLALNAMRALGSPDRQGSYIRSLIRCMDPTRPPRVRCAALRATSEAREELASMRSEAMPQDVDAKLLDDLSRAILSTIVPYRILTGRDDGLETDFSDHRDLFYFRLIFCLATNDEWRQRLSSHGYLGWCISQVDFRPRDDVQFYLAGTLLRIDPSGTDLPINLCQEKWKTIEFAWCWLAYIGKEETVCGCLDVLPAFVEAARRDVLPSLRSWRLHHFASAVQEVLEHLHATMGRADKSLLNAALPAVQELYNDLCCMCNSDR